MGERQGLAPKGVRAVEGEKRSCTWLVCCETSVRARGLSTNECEHLFV